MGECLPQMGRLVLDHPQLLPAREPDGKEKSGDKKGLRTRLQGDHQKWDQYLLDILFTLRHRYDEALGVSPIELLLGRPLQCPKEWD
ncbi:hypothetical protein PR048_018030 [Dryococelus australis]|uniref:Uncharacterized protein n=1 Tax=Dryococelus australis TaxID=614101 RepID=A0ABQ9HB45_9NEOP|nr:hypothetical protein PR048_018030 [Dryococelus australis]